MYRWCSVDDIDDNEPFFVEFIKKSHLESPFDKIVRCGSVPDAVALEVSRFICTCGIKGDSKT